MRDLLQHPLCLPDDLGQPIPDSPHAVSVCLPTWEHVVAYEEEDPAVLSQLQCGYPRFFPARVVWQLFDSATSQLGVEGERAIVFPSLDPALRCIAFVAEHARARARVEPFGDLFAVLVPDHAWEAAKSYWRFCGEIVSSRLAASALAGSPPPDGGRTAKHRVRDHLAQLTGQLAEDVYLFPSGMAAIFTAHRMVTDLAPAGARSVQLEFPYVDVLKIQQRFGSGVHFYPLAGHDAYEEIRSRISRGEPLSAVYCELASNPLLRSVDVLSLAKILEGSRIPMIIDDTVGCVANIDAFRAADIVSTSLTKYYSGTGDVMAGSLILRRDSPFRDRFRDWLSRHCDDDLADADALALAANGSDFESRFARMNQAAETIYDWLITREEIEEIWYPKGTQPETYKLIHRPGSGYGALLSLTLKDPSKTPKFYDSLKLTKGPSLGTNFTLACPYTLLAHYHELDWAASCGVPSHLVRISVGLEDPADLIARIAAALDFAHHSGN